MSPTLILTHRGLQPSTADFYSESSLEAFTSQLAAGFGLEFDFNLTQDKQLVILHDPTLNRVSQGKDLREVGEVTAAELRRFLLPKGHICFFDDLAPLLEKSSATLHAFHIKGSFQNKESLEILAKELKKYPKLLAKLILFDLKPDSAEFLKSEVPELHVAASVAHNFDIQRYNSVVKGTLLSLEEVTGLRNLYDWVWLDEWDLSDETGQKKFYTKENFSLLRQHGFKIALVTPELHSTSPGLLGGEAHPDAQNQEKLFLRIRGILKLQPDAVCTDYPEEVEKMIDSSGQSSEN